MHKINISPEAFRDMENIKNYISYELFSPQAAQKLLINIRYQISLLQTSPLIGSPLSAKIEIETDYRYLVSNNYLVFYRLHKNDVFILRVLYGKSDYLKILFD